MTRALVVALVLQCWCEHRQRCAAPAGWYVNGARPDGSYELRSVLGRIEDDIDDARRRIDLLGPAPVRGWLYCTGGQTLHQDGRSVWCSR